MCITIPRSGFIPTNIKLKDFCPINNWEVVNSSVWNNENAPAKKLIGLPKHLKDKTTNRFYWNERKKVVRIKCLLLIVATPLAHTIGMVLNIAYRIIKLVTLSHFWIKKEGEGKYDFKARLKDAGKDLARIIASPIAMVGMELAAIYGLFRPYDGRKFYGTCERAIYGNALVAHCFQPSTAFAHGMRLAALKNCFKG